MSIAAQDIENRQPNVLFSGLGNHCRTATQTLQPECCHELQTIITQAFQRKQPVYPIGKGNNWGYGYRTPPSDGCILLDLSQMNRIIGFDNDLGVIEIEPGVTQGQIADYLENTPWMIDCTGAGPNTSVMGNVLERGFGHGSTGNRSQHFMISELILAHGEMIHLDRSSRYCGRAGLSANLHELFTQNNLAVISKMKFELTRKPESSLRCLVRLKSAADLPTYIETMRLLKSEGTIDGLPHLGNTYRMLTMMERFNFERWDGKKGADQTDIDQLCTRYKLTPWSGAFVVTGSKGIAKAKAKRIKAALQPFAKVDIVSLKKLKQLDRLTKWMTPTLGFLQGYRRFQNSLSEFTEMMDMLEGNPKDLALKGCYWRYRGTIPDKMNPVADGAGFFWVAPTLPMVGEEVDKCMRLSKQAFDKAGFEFGVTLTAVNAYMCQAIVSVYYDSGNQEEVERATELTSKLRDLYRRHQWPCYRRSVDEMPFDIGQELEGDALKLRFRIKTAFDPNNLVSPGRYQINSCPSYSTEIHQ
ncbi:FAD-binding oxidoreductase [Vibrio ostreicida]|uniref:FAD-dependent oxidoreductase n=1 Tax=Vibrio ostreicida TaxID=526588 RepID=UPI003B5A51B4